MIIVALTKEVKMIKDKTAAATIQNKCLRCLRLRFADQASKTLYPTMAVGITPKIGELKIGERNSPTRVRNQTRYKAAGNTK